MEKYYLKSISRKRVKRLKWIMIVSSCICKEKIKRSRSIIIVYRLLWKNSRKTFFRTFAMIISALITNKWSKPCPIIYWEAKHQEFLFLIRPRLNKLPEMGKPSSPSKIWMTPYSICNRIIILIRLNLTARNL